MEKGGYERYGLIGNPFRDLASETIEAIELLHVKQSLDQDLTAMAAEVREKINKSVILLMGGHGMGKTERLMLIQNECGKNGELCVFRNVSAMYAQTVQSLCEGIVDGYRKQKKKKLLTPKWIAKVNGLVKRSKRAVDPENAARTIAEALNHMTPSFLLLNDLQGLKDAKETEAFNTFMNSLLNAIGPGVMVVITCEMDYFRDVICGEAGEPGGPRAYDDFISKKNALKDRINRQMIIPPLSKNEAMLMVAKRLLVKRLVDDLPSIYPFSEGALDRMNKAVQGNPRQLLKLSDHVIEMAAKARAVQVDEEFVESALSTYPGTIPGSAVPIH